MKNFILIDKEHQDAFYQDLYRFMPVYVQHDGQTVRVIAQNGNNVYYIKEA